MAICRDDPSDNFTDSESFKSKIKITVKIPDDGNTKDLEITMPSKYLVIFLRILEMSLSNCEVNLILTWTSTCVIINSTGAGWFVILDTKLYVPGVSLST